MWICLKESSCELAEPYVCLNLPSALVDKALALDLLSKLGKVDINTPTQLLGLTSDPQKPRNLLLK